MEDISEATSGQFTITTTTTTTRILKAALVVKTAVVATNNATGEEFEGPATQTTLSMTAIVGASFFDDRCRWRFGLSSL